MVPIIDVLNGEITQKKKKRKKNARAPGKTRSLIHRDYSAPLLSVRILFVNLKGGVICYTTIR